MHFADVQVATAVPSTSEPVPVPVLLPRDVMLEISFGTTDAWQRLGALIKILQA